MTLCELLEGNSGSSVSIEDCAPDENPGRGDAAFLVAGNDGPGLRGQLRRLRESGVLARMPVLAVGRFPPDETTELLASGLSDFVTPPLGPHNVFPRLWRWVEREAPSPDEQWLSDLRAKLGLEKIIGESPAFVSALRCLPKVAGVTASVLVSGETGTGKEVFARAIHYLGPRKSQPFVPVNCGAIPSDLVENELFGHERGAYTGATGAGKGLLAVAEGGTLFLDEINALPLASQVKLLRFIQEKEYRALGSIVTRHSDVRTVAAANIDLSKAVQDGDFRQDLYYRLNVVPIKLPPLRDREGDLPLFVRHFLKRHGTALDRPGVRLTPCAMEKLRAWSWPGNVRELEFVIERALILSDEPVISARHIMLNEDSEPGLERTDSDVMEPFQTAKARHVANFERTYLERGLRACGGNISRAARAANKNRRAYFELIKRHNIDVDKFRALACNSGPS